MSKRKLNIFDYNGIDFYSEGDESFDRKERTVGTKLREVRFEKKLLRIFENSLRKLLLF